ncbi:PP2C family protein-serine/threonine phosphatase [Thiocystis violacea]|uniref:PP2C family protein-serine/threonine phosphatase n=1 Tax=Thiocystis violacea TaxID=13725 RepID=UPI001904DF2A|nr:protein phosphatase 2C domain-containing protein [Thiocystis violacea]MBK1721553.1 serine/threonine protein phosphatase [Thiocystis violacea]
MTKATASITWKSGGASHPGRVRGYNQDAYLDRPELGLWVVADGMGGHSSGGMASSLIVERLAMLSHPRLLGVAADEAGDILSQVNQQLVAEAQLLQGDIIGSTVVIVIAVGDHCVLLWAGDSRAYRLRNGELLQLTLDHTQVQEMVDQGILTPEQAESHPLSNVLVRAVGGDIDLALDRRVEALAQGDRYLLCSDGLVKELSLERIREILAEPEPAGVAQTLVEAACEAGGRDNVTALVIDFGSCPA